jgi:hypothetical protein
MWVRVWLAGACLAGLLGACAVIDPVDSRYDTIGRSLTKARNEAIFLNLVRASHDYPLEFTTISNVTPSMSNTSALGLPSFLLGPPAGFGTAAGAVASLPTSSPGRDVIFGSTTASNTTAISTNFSVSTQETSAFYLGFLKPIDLQTLNYFIRQGYSRELLFWLFTDSFEVTTRYGKFGYKYDPPNDFGCDPTDRKNRCFKDWVHIATLVGLTVEEKSLEKPSSGKSSDSSNTGGSSKPATTIYARFCNNQILAEQAQAVVGKTSKIVQDLFHHDLDVKIPELYGANGCGQHWTPPPPNQPQSDTFPLEFPASGVTFRIIPRSAYGVFEFLGTLIKMQSEDFKWDAKAYNPPNVDRERLSERPHLASVNGDQDLITVVHGRDVDGRCFSHTWFYDGDYCVPENATNTKRIFGLLAQLIAIQTAAADLSITPLVRIVQ